ncbi:MAG TPA: tRNA (adenosine(37)-N6)-threonylcarbamoyltransferase complex dimerization subunit type 1 TsaB [Tissierellia bacterium]|nr:tRNA (adenosine(37)-N6)-threonylcarbamoyltransferase complex dimerization subunit type 1 TsaB [Tissierellia bacterium]
MKVLAVDTSTVIATCAVMEDENLLGEYSLNQNMSHSENLVPMIKEVLDSLKLHVRDIDLYGVAVGPGSFTGLRIGIATVKAFAHVYNKPIVGISTLEALAFNLSFNGLIVPMIDARRNRVYTGIYRWKRDRLINVMEPTVMDINNLIETLPKEENILVNGNAVYIHKDHIKDKLGDRVHFAQNIHNHCRALSVAELALKKVDNTGNANYYNLVPEYIKESQAQGELRKKESDII